MREFQVGDLIKFNHKRGHKGVVVGDEAYDDENRLCYPVYWFHLNEMHNTPWTVIRKVEVEGE